MIYGNLKAEIIALAKRPGGMRTANVTTPCASSTAATTCNKMARLGEIFASRLGHRSIRYFGTLVEAAAHQKNHAPRDPHVGRPAPAPTRTQFDKQTAIIPEGIKPIICTGYTGQSKYSPAPGFVGEFTADWQRRRA